MNITEFMSFDLEWFTTLPGLLITGGVIVLLIALIIFIISNKKSDKKLKEEVVEQQPVEVQEEIPPVNAEVPFEPQMQINEMAPTVDMPVVPEVTNVPINNIGSNEPVDITYNSNGSVNILGNPQTNGIMPPVSTAVEIPTFFEQNVPSQFNSATPVNNNVMDFSNSDPSAVQPVVAPVGETASVIEPVTNMANNEVTTPSTVESMPSVPVEVSSSPVMSMPEVATQPVVEEARPAIYGGVSPVNTFNQTPVVEAKPVIYGGANPLENTTTLPVMNNHGAYNASGNNTYNEPNTTMQSVISPVAEVTQPVAQVAPVTAMPEVNQTPVEPVVVPQMPMTAAEMFGTNDISSNNVSINSSNEIETLEF